MKKIIQSAVIISLITSIAFSQDDTNASIGSKERSVSPMIQIRYDNFANRLMVLNAKIRQLIKLSNYNLIIVC